MKKQNGIPLASHTLAIYAASIAIMTTATRLFDFDYWKKLFETDPKAFETRRQEVIDNEICRAPQATQRRLRMLQWKIDATRRRYKHPQVSSTKLFEMMWDKVYGSNGLLEALTTPYVKASDAPESPPTKNVVPIQRDGRPK